MTESILLCAAFWIVVAVVEFVRRLRRLRRRSKRRDPREAGMRIVTLELDPYDYDAIQAAFGIRQSWGDIPQGKSNLSGRILADVCRDWLDLYYDELHEGSD